MRVQLGARLHTAVLPWLLTVRSLPACSMKVGVTRRGAWARDQRVAFRDSNAQR